MKPNRLIFCFLLLPVILFTQPIFADTVDLKYQNRGDRYEGLLPEPIGCPSIELLSVMAFRETIKDLPERLMIKLILPSNTLKPYVKVQEIEQETFHVMDNPTFQKPGSFEWDTGVLRQAVKKEELDVNNLGIIARLKGKDEPMVKEEIAPALLYSGVSPKTISRYTFAFKTNDDAELEYIISSDNGLTLVEKLLGRKKGNKSFKVNWDAQGQPEGYYTLLINGYFRVNNSPLSQSVRFYHKPTP